jgi:hypothetical protein
MALVLFSTFTNTKGDHIAYYEHIFRVRVVGLRWDRFWNLSIIKRQIIVKFNALCNPKGKESTSVSLHSNLQLVYIARQT